MPLRIGNGAGFLGDNLDAPRLLAEAGRLDYLTLEYLAELTMSILARQREKDPRAGYATDFIDALRSLESVLRGQPKLRIITNAGGVNPNECAKAAARTLAGFGRENERIGVVSGDDLVDRYGDLESLGLEFWNLDTGKLLESLGQPLVSAHAYLGARPIVEALRDGARLVVTGRVADASLTVAPAVHEFGWKWDDWDKLAGASVAGHLIECGAQVTGGYSTAESCRDLNLTDVGYPIAEIADDATCVITKPPGTGGVVNRQTVVEQLVYEIGDPRHYLTPDVDVDFTTVEVDDLGSDRVAVRGATGRTAPDSYKVSAAHNAGYTASGQLLVFGRDAADKARVCADIVVAHVRRAGFNLERVCVEYLGSGESSRAGSAGRRFAPQESIVPKSAGTAGPTQIVLRIAVQDPRREAVERFTRELAPLITSGPAGLAGYTSGRGPVRPVFAYWPTLIPKSLVEAKIDVHPAKEWLG